MNNKLYFQLILYPIVLIILSAAVITSYHMYQFVKNEKEIINDLSSSYITNKKKIIYTKVHYTVEKLKIMQELFENQSIHKDEIINKILIKMKDIEKNCTDDLFIVELYNINGGENFGKIIFSNNVGKVGIMLNDNKICDRKIILKRLKETGEVYHECLNNYSDMLEPKTKLVYIFHYKPLNLIVGSSFYLNELDQQIDIIKKDGKEKITLEIASTLIVTSILLVLIVILSYISMKKITKLMKKNEKKINELNNSLQDKVTSQINQLRSKDLILAQKSKAQSLGEMLSLITHQWRQPLSAINSITAKIYKDCKIDNLNPIEMKNNIAQIEELTHYMSQTITDFSTFYKPSKNKENFTLSETIQSTLNILFPKYYKDTKPEIEFISTNEITLYGYKSQVQQIILSILNNSIENFNTRNIKEPKIKIVTIKQNNTAIIKIEDNGGGIKNIDIDKIFDLYFSTKDDSDSRGMGLYIAKMMSQACLNGDLKVKNTKEGAMFSLSCDINEKI